MPTFTADSHFDDRTMLKEDGGEEPQKRPLLDSVRSLVDKERQLAGLQLEEKEREAELWRKRYMQLQNETGFDPTVERDDGSTLTRTFVTGSTHLGATDDDWDNLQAASKKAGDSCLGKLRRQESLDLSRRQIGKQDLEGVITKLRWLRGFTSVDLSDNNVDDSCTYPLKNLLALRQLCRLNLRGNDLGPSAAKALLESLPRCKDLQVLRLEANVPFSRAPGAGAHLAAGLRAAVKAGGCRYLWSLSVTLDDFDSSFFMNATRKAEKTSGLATTPGHATRSSHATAPPAPSLQTPAHPMNALAFARAFHPRAPGGGAGALLNGDKAGITIGGRGRGAPNNKVATGPGRGSITSLGLPYARLHPRTIEALATYAISSLTHLDLSFCHVGAAGAAALARALDGNSNTSKGGASLGGGSHSLRSLKLPHNFVGDSGACALGRALSNNRCLTFLSLASNGIGFVGGRALAAALGTRGEPVDGGDDGGGSGSGLARLDVGDNPLGEKAAKLLVAAASTASGGGAAVTVQILGLDRVAGTTVATRAAAPRVDAADERISLEKDGVALAASPTLVAIDEEVSVQSEDASGDGGRLVQAYQVLLDSRFEPPAGKPAESEGGCRGRCSTLDVQWSFLSDRSPLDVCEWRVSRLRLGESEFVVKEGIGTEEGPAGWQTGSGDNEPRDGFSRVRLRCNGWNKSDVLKIFVRPGGGGRVKCCDLAIGLAGNAPPSAPSSSYGLLWADPARVDGGFEGNGGRLEEDCPRSPSIAECARVALLMSGINNNNRLHPSVTTDAGSRGGNDGDGSAHALHCLRQVHVAHGGRIRTSWNAVLAATPVQRRSQANTGDWSSSGYDVNSIVGGQRSLCGYSWALVRSRGVAGDERCSLACRVMKQGSVSDRSTVPRYTGDHGGVIGSEEQGGNDKASVNPSTEEVSSTLSPWRWQCFDVDTTAWLPGDLLSLWIRLDELGPSPPPSFAPGGGTSPVAAGEGSIGRRGNSRRLLPLRYHPLVRAFELRAVDDARAEEAARGHCALSREHHERPVVSCSGTRLDGGSAARFGEACFYPPVFSAAASGPGTSVAAVQLDLAADCPMNMAAAGGLWA